MNTKLLKKLKQAGCNFIAFGIESIDEEVLKLMKKGTSFDMVKKAINEAKECGIGVGGFFMIGTPGDTYEKFRKSYVFADQDIFDEVRFYNTEPYPGTEIYEWVKKNGKFLVEPEEYLNSRSRWEENPIFETDNFSAKERKKAFNQGEFLVAKKLITKVLGKNRGKYLVAACRVKWFRRFIMFAGFKFAPLIFKAIVFLKDKKYLSRAIPSEI